MVSPLNEVMYMVLHNIIPAYPVDKMMMMIMYKIGH